MKNIKTLLLALLLCGNTAIAQVKQGKVVYVADFTGVINKSVKKGNMKLATTMRTVAAIAKDIKLELVFNQNESTFKRAKAMPMGLDPGFYENAADLALDGDYYTNLKTNELTKTVQDDKTYIISLPPIKASSWTLGKESRKIGKYTCYKATSTKAVDGPRGMVNVQLTAWYAPEIPVRFGPKQYSNLPGLVLEMQEGEVLYRCVSIALNQAANTSVSKPVKGTQITETAYDKMVAQRLTDFKMNEGVN